LLFDGQRIDATPDTWVRTAAIPYYGPLHPRIIKDINAPTKSGRQMQNNPKEPEFVLEAGQVVYKHRDRYLVCSEKERDILQRQSALLPPETFDQLVADFHLKDAALVPTSG
jgi:hypothetical protein